MPQPSRKQSANLFTILSVSPMGGDHRDLEGIYRLSGWKLLRAGSTLAALTLLNRFEVSVVLCERDLGLGNTWIGMLEAIQTLPYPPSLIVTSRVADDRLWAEALNLGAWDVLAKPFDCLEVLRSVRSAWRYWHQHVHAPAPVMKVMGATS